MILIPEGPPGDDTCSDGIDNDADTLVDEDDPDCVPPTTMMPTMQPTAAVAAVTPAALPVTGAQAAGDGDSLAWLAVTLGAVTVVALGSGLGLVYARRRGR